jgi:hypothetical protein
MDSPSPPQAPDPVVIAGAQGAANLEAARTNTTLNRPNQITPYGSLTWENNGSFDQAGYDAAMAAYNAGQTGGVAGGATSAATSSNPYDSIGTGWQEQQGDPDPYAALRTPPPTPGTAGSTGGTAPRREDYMSGNQDQWTSRVTLDPRVQALVDAQLQTSQGLTGAINTSLERVSNLQPAMDPSTLFGAAQSNLDKAGQLAPEASDAVRKRVEDALYSQAQSRLDPRFAAMENERRSTLMNRGLTEGSEVWDREMQNFGRERNDAYDTAQWGATARGGEEMQRLFGMELEAANFARGLAGDYRNLDATRFDTSNAYRNNAINELSALRSGAQVSMPTFSNAMTGGTMAPAPVAQSAYNSYQGQMGQYNADVASNNAFMSGLFSLGGAAMGGMF